MKGYRFPKGLTWREQLTVYRNDYAHRGYFGFETNEEMRNIGLTSFHLHDVFVRIAFSMLGYKGKYRSSIDGQERTVDWVTKETSAGDLGYATDTQGS